MNTYIKSSVLIAAVGAVAFALHTSDSDMVSLYGAPDATSGSSVVASPAKQDVFIASLEQYSVARGDIDESYAVEPYTDISYGAESTLSVSAGANARPVRSKQETEERKQRSATAKMSGPVAALALAGGPGKAEVIVSYHDHPELFEDGRVEELGGEVLRRYEVLKLLAISIPAESLVELAIEDDVDRVSLDEAVFAGSAILKTVANVPSYQSSNSSYRGDGQTVAILDTGVAAHRDLSGDVRQYSFLNGAYAQPAVDNGNIYRYNSDPLVDGYGHGTHIAGIVSGNGFNSDGSYRGPARQADVLSLQVLDENGHGQMSDVMAALDWLLQYGSYFDVSVVNLSLGKPITESNTTDPLVAAVEAVWDSGIVVVVAAGNYGREGYFSTTSPGNSRKVITVGSLTDNGTGYNFDDDYVSTYSSRGPTVVDHVVKPDLVAPGNRLIAAAPGNSNLAALLPKNVVACTATSSCLDGYLELSGTSMATGVVSAAAAMMLEKDPSLSPATVKARLMRSARKLDESPVVAGAGLLDIDAALNETGLIPGQALSPLMRFDKESGGTLVQDTASLWGNDLWGAGYLWTDGGGVGANGYLWTDGGVNANGYLWTDGGIWANGYLWTDGGVAAFGYLWTDGVDANGYLWTDGGVGAKGYLWTDGGGMRAQSLFDLDSSYPSLNDDGPTSD
ncbi:MAG: S8 family peptidase [Woeseiaceae bacterium]